MEVTFEYLAEIYAREERSLVKISGSEYIGDSGTREMKLRFEAESYKMYKPFYGYLDPDRIYGSYVEIDPAFIPQTPEFEARIIANRKKYAASVERKKKTRAEAKYTTLALECMAEDELEIVQSLMDEFTSDADEIRKEVQEIEDQYAQEIADGLIYV